MRIAYFYLMRDEPNRVRCVAPEHATYWDRLGLPEYVGGPLADRSGGLITFQAGSVGEAESLVANDPFMRAELLETARVNEWMVEPPESAQDLRPTGRGSAGR